MTIMMFYSGLAFASENGDSLPLIQVVKIEDAINEARESLQRVRIMKSVCCECNNNGNPFYARSNREGKAIAHTLLNAIDAKRLGRHSYTREKVSTLTKCWLSMQDSCDCIDYLAIDSQVKRSGEKASFSCDCGSGPISLGCSEDCCGEYEKRKRVERLLNLAFQKAHGELGRSVTSVPEIDRS